MIASTKIPTAGYLRMSSDKQETSVEQQREAIIMWAAENGYVIVAWYIDEGVSGWKSEQRHSFQGMIDDAQKGKFRAVLVWDLDRFSRFPVLEANHYWYLLDKAGVQLATVNQGRIDFADLGDWLKASVQQHGKSQYVQDLSRNVLRGKLAKAREGQWTVEPPIGYRVEREWDAEGKKVVRRFLVPGDQAEVAVVKRIFRDYLAGQSLRGIADALNVEGIRPRKWSEENPIKWSATVIRKVLIKPAYVGRVVWNMESIGEFSRVRGGSIAPAADGQRVNDPADWIVREGMHEPLIEDGTFLAVQRRLKQRAVQRTPHRNGGKFKLTPLIYCGHCGRRMIGHTDRGIIYYMCGGYVMNGNSSCKPYNVRQDRVLEMLSWYVDRHFLAPNNKAKVTAELRRGAKEAQRQADLPKLRRELGRAEARLTQYTKRMLECAVDMLDDVQAAIRELRAEQERIRTEILIAETPARQLQDEQDRAVAEAFSLFARFAEMLKDGDPVKVRAYCQRLFLRIVVLCDRTKTGKRAKHTIREVRVTPNTPEIFASFLLPAPTPP